MFPESVAFIGNHVPRQCGIATFTTDLAAAVGAQGAASWVMAMNDRPQGYHYPDIVRFEVQEKRLSEYRLAAEFLNQSRVDVVCLQHEYGIFGGPSGSYVLDLLEALRIPVVTTLHTVLRDPDEQQRSVMQEIARLSDRLVVMADRARAFLTEIYGIPASKVVLVPHGIPDMPFVDPSYFKDNFGVEGRTVLLTFGLLSPGKGIEFAIRALPDIVSAHPDVVYVVLGATHPNVKRDHGEVYRQQLQTLARELGVEKHVMFHNHFVDLDELCRYLGAVDLYVTPYLGEAQIVSGTLAYALGAGKAVVSTPYWYAQEMLDDGRGKIVPFRDPAAIARAVREILDDRVEMAAMRKRAYSFTRDMVWPAVGRSYLRVFEEACAERRKRPRPVPVRRTAESFGESLPELELAHLRVLTDDTGLLQHACFAIPDRIHGYCTDDNARALIVALGARGLGAEANLIPTYASFLQHAYNDDVDRFRNFMSYDRRWLEEFGSDDSHGRAVWALGTLVAESRRDWEKWLGMSLLKKGLQKIGSFTSPRTQAFGVLGLAAYLREFSGDREAAVVLDILANALHARLLANATPEWMWLESIATYDNARIPHALLVAGQASQRQDMIDSALLSLDWLLRVQITERQTDGTPAPYLVPIGNDGWLKRGGTKARFGQQPLEAGALTEACLQAYAITRDVIWMRNARLCFDWFLGRNDLRLPLCDLATGGCRDGLDANGVNRNQGAESTLSWLMALIAMHRHAAAFPETVAAKKSLVGANA